MATNYGKGFEDRFKKDFLLTVPNSTIDRLYDTMNGYKAISQVSDFIGYSHPNIFYLECKSHAGASIPFTAISQYDKLKSKVGIKGVRAGVIVWLYEKETVFYLPVSTMTQMLKDGKKSAGLKAIDEGYNIKVLPSKKLKFYMTTDYSSLLNLEEGE